MGPEEQIDNERWYVLQKIKREYLRTKSGEPVKYWVNFDFVGGDNPSGKNEAATLEKLEELGVIKILNLKGTWEYE